MNSLVSVCTASVLEEDGAKRMFIIWWGNMKGNRIAHNQMGVHEKKFFRKMRHFDLKCLNFTHNLNFLRNFCRIADEKDSCRRHTKNKCINNLRYFSSKEEISVCKTKHRIPYIVGPIFYYMFNNLTEVSYLLQSVWVCAHVCMF